MTKDTMIGVDLAKSVFQVHGASMTGQVKFRKKLTLTCSCAVRRAGALKWSGKTGQAAKMYPTLTTGYTNDEETQFFGQV